MPHSPTKIYHRRPKLEEIIEDAAPLPYTLSAFRDFLYRQHCLETLEFILEVRRYRKAYSLLQLDFRDSTTNNEWITHMMVRWQHLMTTYIAPSAPYEINIPPKVREELLKFANNLTPPPPEVLEAPVQTMHALINDSILMPFFKDCCRKPHEVSFFAPELANTWSIPSSGVFNDYVIKNCSSTEPVSELGYRGAEPTFSVNPEVNTRAQSDEMDLYPRPQNEGMAYLQNSSDINTADSQDSCLTRSSEQHLGKRNRLYNFLSLARKSLKRLKK